MRLALSCILPLAQEQHIVSLLQLTPRSPYATLAALTMCQNIRDENWEEIALSILLPGATDVAVAAFLKDACQNRISREQACHRFFECVANEIFVITHSDLIIGVGRWSGLRYRDLRLRAPSYCSWLLETETDLSEGMLSVRRYLQLTSEL